MLTNRKHSIGKALLIMGLCLTITLGTFAVVTTTPALAGGSGGAHAVEKAGELTEKEQLRIKRANMRISDEDWEWGYPIYTLIIRFVGIFVVLGFIQVVMQISGRIFVKIEQNKKAKA